MSAPTKPPVPYPAVAAAFIALVTARHAVMAATAAEQEASAAFDKLVLDHVGVGRKIVLDMGPPRTGADPAARASGTYLLVSVVQLATGVQVQTEVVKK